LAHHAIDESPGNPNYPNQTGQYIRVTNLAYNINCLARKDPLKHDPDAGKNAIARLALVRQNARSFNRPLIWILIQLQSGQGSLHQLAAYFLFLLRRNPGIAHHVNDGVAENQAIGTHHLGDGQRRGDLYRWNTCFFQLSRDRSAAASAGSSGGGQDHGVDTALLRLLGHLTAHAACVRERIG
jgi:hypothetical protein